MTYFILNLSLIILTIFIIMFLRKPYRLINGFMFDCFLVTFLIGLMLFLGEHPNTVTRILLWILIVVVGLILIFGLFIVIGYLLINSIKMAKKERRNFSNSLSLLLVVGIILQIILSVFFTRYMTNDVTLILFSLFYSVEFYLLMSVACFITLTIILQFHTNWKRRDYIIILGCGLIDGNRVSPLLAGRINKAINVFLHQKKKNDKVKLLFSGGKGSNEDISEAEAMQAYAIQQGVDAEDTIIENKSVNTLENMKFSKKIMDENSQGNYSCTYVTSNYHIYRAGIYAYKAGIRKVNGVGSKTKGYYIPNAMIREYIALLVMNKKFNFIIIGLIFMIYMMGLIVKIFV